MGSLSRASWPVERRTLDNGLRVVLHPDSSLPLVAINLWYHVGSKNEVPGRTGFAHLFEHMLFQGSEHVGTNDHFRYVQQVGGVANGSTSYDRTNYYETLPAHCLELGLWLESDRLGFLLPAMTQEKLDNQRDVVMNERRQRVDNQPYGRAFERLQELSYTEPHPYHWPILGYMEDIAAATLEDVSEFFGRYYVPNNAVLSLAGDFEPDSAYAAVERYFGPIEGGAEVLPVQAELQPIDGERHEVQEDDVELARLYMAYHAPPVTDDSWYVADLFASALTGGKSSPLYHDLAHERQLVQDVSTMVLPTELAATFLVVATARPGIGLRQVQEAIDEHLARAATETLPGPEIDRAHNRFQTSYVDQLQNLDHRAELLSRLTTYHDAPERIDSELERYLDVGATDLTDFAAAYLCPDRRVVLDVVPRESAS
jgi:zinc protease